MKAGLGSASVKLGDLIVSAMVLVNSFGDIYDFTSKDQIAGVYDYKEKKLLNTIDIMKKNNQKLGFSPTNTTIGIVATNAILTKSEGNKLAEMAHNGFARSINPVHTMMDGDTIFTMATNKVEADISMVGTLAAEAMSKAITNGVKLAKTSHGLKSYNEIR